MSKIKNISKGDWIRLINVKGCRILTIGNSYKIEKIIYANNPHIKLVEVRNDLGDLGRYTIERFELDIIKTRSESIDEILTELSDYE